MKFLRGIISDRIRSGDIPGESLTKGRTPTADEVPSPAAVRAAGGHGLGKGATEARTPTGRDAD